MARSLVDDPQLRPLWEAVHARLCRGDLTERSTVTITDTDSDVRRAVDRLLGRVSTSGRLTVRVAALNIVLARAGITAQDAAVEACGPVIDRAAARTATGEARTAAWTRIFQHPAAAEPALAAWLEQLQASGRLGRAGGETAVRAALDVLEVLPVHEPTGRPVLAAALLGNEHALDDHTEIERLVTAGLAARTGIERPTTAAARASLWASSGVSFDSVSAPVLTLGLRPHAVGPLTDAANRWVDAGVPLPIPAAALAAETWTLPAGTTVFACENPSVLEAAAARLGTNCPPLICVSGVPGRAATVLLDQLAAGGATIRYHGDFGTGGVVIANLIIRRHLAEPWRMSSADFAAAASRLAGRASVPLRGRVPEALWDPDLAAAITAHGLEVTEEHVLEDLLADLSGSEQLPTPPTETSHPELDAEARRRFAPGVGRDGIQYGVDM